MKSELLKSDLEIREKDKIEVCWICSKCNHRFLITDEKTAQNYIDHEC